MCSRSPPVSRSEECPFCVDAPVKENGKKCVGVCRNPQNVPGKSCQAKVIYGAIWGQSLDVCMQARIPSLHECMSRLSAPLPSHGTALRLPLPAHNLLTSCTGIGPLVFPHEMQTAEDAVRLQVNAMRDNDVPRANHGIQVLYEYAVEAGQMDRSCYFGWSSDLYHFDHFMVRRPNGE